MVVAAVMTSGCALLRDYSALPEPAEASPETSAETSVNWIARGDSAYEREAFAQAVVWYREAARNGQQEAVAWYNAANAMVRLDRHDEAVKAYQRSLRVAPGFLKAHQNLAALHQLAGNGADAAHHYEAAARLDVTDANARYRLGELADQMGDAVEALQWFEQALIVDALHEGAASGKARVLLEAGDTAAALAWMERYNMNAMSASRPAGWALMLQADLALATGRREEGLLIYREAAALAPDDARPWLRMARALRDAGRPLDAGIALRQGLVADSARGELWAALGGLRFEGGDPLGARDAFARAFRLGSREGVQGLEMLAGWHERRQEGEAARAVRDTLGFGK